MSEKKRWPFPSPPVSRSTSVCEKNTRKNKRKDNTFVSIISDMFIFIFIFILRCFIEALAPKFRKILWKAVTMKLIFREGVEQER